MRSGFSLLVLAWRSVLSVLARCDNGIAPSNMMDLFDIVSAIYTGTSGLHQTVPWFRSSYVGGGTPSHLYETRLVLPALSLMQATDSAYMNPALRFLNARIIQVSAYAVNGTVDK